ncbi:MAG TPA: hypothetical protein GXZ26_09250 [Firmicutes bacterium]|nr:hypothetical protein [Bacillota bacterium]
MGRVIPFPLREEKNPGEERLTDALIREKILTGEAELLGVFEEEGCPYSCYRLRFDDQTYYIFDLTSRRQ